MTQTSAGSLACGHLIHMFENINVPAFRSKWLPRDIQAVWHSLHSTHSFADREQKNSSQAAHYACGCPLWTQGTIPSFVCMHFKSALKHQTREFNTKFVSFQVRVVILADHPLEDIFVQDGDHSHDEGHILMDDLGLKRVSGDSVSTEKPDLGNFGGKHRWLRPLWPTADSKWNPEHTAKSKSAHTVQTVRIILTSISVSILYL